MKHMKHKNKSPIHPSPTYPTGKTLRDLVPEPTDHIPQTRVPMQEHLPRGVVNGGQKHEALIHGHVRKASLEDRLRARSTSSQNDYTSAIFAPCAFQ